MIKLAQIMFASIPQAVTQQHVQMTARNVQQIFAMVQERARILRKQAEPAAPLIPTNARVISAMGAGCVRILCRTARAARMTERRVRAICAMRQECVPIR